MPEDGRLVSEMFRIKNEIAKQKQVANPTPNQIRLKDFMECVEKQTLTIFGDGNQKRSFCHVKNTVKGLIALMESNTNEPINIGNPNEITVNEAIAIFEKKYGALNKKYKTALKDDPTNRCPDITKAKELLGWQPTIKFEDGI